MRKLTTWEIKRQKKLEFWKAIGIALATLLGAGFLIIGFMELLIYCNLL